MLFYVFNYSCSVDKQDAELVVITDLELKSPSLDAISDPRRYIVPMSLP